MRKIYFLIMTVIFIFPTLAQACAQKDAGFFCRNNPWDNLSAATVSFPKDSATVLEYSFGKQAMEISINSKKQATHYWVFAPGVYLYPKQSAMEQSQEFSVVEASMGQLRLVSYLLNIAFPAGPASIKEKADIRLENNANAIEFTVDSGTVVQYLSPWSAQGSIESIAPHKFKYSIDFKFVGEKDKAEIMTIIGELEFLPMTFVVPDSLSLTDYNIEVFSKPDLDLSAVNTVAELKKILAKKN